MKQVELFVMFYFPQQPFLAYELIINNCNTYLLLRSDAHHISLFLIAVLVVIGQSLHASLGEVFKALHWHQIIHGSKYFIDVGVGGSGGLEEVDAVLLGEILTLLGGNGLDGEWKTTRSKYSLALEIALVTDEDEVHVIITVLGHPPTRSEKYLLDLLHPVLDVVEGVSISDIVDKEDALSSTEVGDGDGSETILTGSIPNLWRDQR